MRTLLHQLRLPVSAAAAIIALGTAAYAQADVARQIEARLSAAVKKIEAACAEDAKKYCSTVTPGEGRLLLCMEAHEDKISTKCDYAVYEAARNLDRALNRIEQVADACWNDIEKHCANIAGGGGRIAQCLVAQKASLAPACQAEIAKVSSPQ
ncbi:MAG TPA: cysteine rich repeat-containing protein [Xanthobacteraceae bacterium]|nr:cysteine rich repeat-containing protein [Xanthobacteraceae bacterium]